MRHLFSEEKLWEPCALLHELLSDSLGLKQHPPGCLYLQQLTQKAQESGETAPLSLIPLPPIPTPKHVRTYGPTQTQAHTRTPEEAGGRR